MKTKYFSFLVILILNRPPQAQDISQTQNTINNVNNTNIASKPILNILSQLVFFDVKYFLLHLFLSKYEGLLNGAPI